MNADTNRAHLFPEFVPLLHLVMQDLKAYVDADNMPGYKGWIVVEGFRTAEYQKWLYGSGRTRKGSIVTNADGYRNKSNHQSGCAADIVPIKDNGDADWEAPARYFDYLGHCARAHGLEWGGNWKALHDIDHIDIPTSDRAAYARAAAWLKTQEWAK